MNQPSVAICIPTFNQAKYLKAAVESACEQDYPYIQVWVSDDTSTDETQSEMEKLIQRFPQLRYHRQTQNKGIAENSSWLLRQPETDFLVRLDSDDLLAPRYVSTLITMIGEHPDAGYAHTSVRIIDEPGNPIYDRRLMRRNGFQDSETALRSAVSGYRTAGNIILFRTEALKKLSYYEGRPEFVEDYDLSIRMADAGYGNVYAEDVLASYRTWTDEGKKRLKRKMLQLVGFARIFEESLTPAFQRRGWDTRILESQRRKLAKGHATYCYSALFDAQERRELTEALFRLGDSTALRVQIVALKLGFGFVYNIRAYVKGKAKSMCKSAWHAVTGR